MPTQYVIAKIIARDKRCFYCPTKFIEADGTLSNQSIATADHLWPESLLGNDSPRNLVAACHSCNSKRGNLIPDKFRLCSDEKPARIAQLLDLKRQPEWLTGDVENGFAVKDERLPEYLENLYREGRERIKNTRAEKDSKIERFQKEPELLKDAKVASIEKHFESLSNNEPIQE